MSESDIHRRQTLTSKVDPRTQSANVKYEHLHFLFQFIFLSHVLL